MNDDSGPNQLPNFEFVVSHTLRPCWNCGVLTNRVEINFEANLCSAECNAVKEAEYWASLADGHDR